MTANDVRLVAENDEAAAHSEDQPDQCETTVQLATGSSEAPTLHWPAVNNERAWALIRTVYRWGLRHGATQALDSMEFLRPDLFYGPPQLHAVRTPDPRTGPQLVEAARKSWAQVDARIAATTGRRSA